MPHLNSLPSAMFTAALLTTLWLAGCNTGDDSSPPPVPEQCVEDQCGVCDTDPSNDCQQDCAGDWGGAAVEDQCGACDADPTNDCVEDCAGEWGGGATTDMCGVCDADATNDCQQDCAGAWGGEAAEDMCGVCDADASNDCQQDCAGEWGGVAALDLCGVCLGGQSTETSPCQEIILGPDADAMTSQSLPDKNYGVEPYLEVDRDERYTYLRFHLTDSLTDGVWGVRDAKLHLTVTGGRDYGGDGTVLVELLPTSDKWKEEEVSWAMAPDAGGAIAAGSFVYKDDGNGREQAVVIEGEALRRAIDRELMGDGWMTLRLSSPGYQTSYRSREYQDPSAHPRLELTLAPAMRLDLEAGADASVQMRGSGNNLGMEQTLIVDRGYSEAYLRFDLASMLPPGAIIHRAELLATAFSGFAYGGDGNVYISLVADDSWDEATVTWDNRPTPEATSLGSWWIWYDNVVRDQIGRLDSPAFQDALRAELAGDGLLSLHLRSPGYRTTYRSREFTDASQRPRLRIDYYVPPQQMQ